jgi:hypothetical protein
VSMPSLGRAENTVAWSQYPRNEGASPPFSQSQPCRLRDSSRPANYFFFKTKTEVVEIFFLLSIRFFLFFTTNAHSLA